jgi:lysozyme family protein
MGDFIDDIIVREGGDRETNDPADPGGRTKYGISERGNPDLWKDGPPTYAKARARYIERYVMPFNGIKDHSLLVQLVDWGVTSGPKAVVQILQQLVGAKVDGVLGPKTVEKVENYPGGMLWGYQVPGPLRLNLAINQARAIHYASITKARPTSLRFILGWLNRTFSLTT